MQLCTSNSIKGTSKGQEGEKRGAVASNTVANSFAATYTVITSSYALFTEKIEKETCFLACFYKGICEKHVFFGLFNQGCHGQGNMGNLGNFKKLRKMKKMPGKNC